VQLLMLFTLKHLDFGVSGFSTYLQSQTGKIQWKFGGAANDKPTNKAKKYMDKEKQDKYKCKRSTKFCAGLHEKQKDFLRTEQYYVSRTAIKVNR